jgi:hypothetical protein
MAAPEIIGSSRSTYTRAVCMVCEEKGIEYLPTEKPLHAPEIRAIPSARCRCCVTAISSFLNRKPSPPISTAASRRRSSSRPSRDWPRSPSNGCRWSTR